MRQNRSSMTVGWLLPLTILALTAVSPAERCLAAGRSRLVPGGWNPSLEDVRTYVDEDCSGATKSQRALTEASRSRTDLRDAQLFITYVLLIDALDEAGRARLFNEQKQWLAKRERLAQAAVVSKGGTLEPVEYSGAFRKITEERLAVLEKRLAERRAKQKPSTPKGEVK